MTLQELNEYLALGETLERNEELLANLESAAQPGAQVITGMPHATGVKDRVGDLAIEIADMQEDIEVMRAQLEQQSKEVQRFIKGIPDAQLRLVFRLRFVRRLSFKEIAGVMGGYRTENAVRHLIYSYFEEVKRLDRLSGGKTTTADYEQLQLL